MSEKELKISELASLWSVSVPSTWNRVRKEGLTTVKKVDENKKEVTFVQIPENILNKYLTTVENNINNHYYEELLTNNNVYKEDNNVNNDKNIDNNNISALDILDRITTINNDYNNRLERVNEELITAKSKMLLLEDKAGREGLYINEINGLKTDNNRLKRVIYGLLSLIVLLLLSMAVYITAQVITSNVSKNTVIQTQKKEVKPTAQPHKEFKK